MGEGDYLFGTRNDEVARLGLQHRVWRPQMLDGFRRARFGPGQTLIDVGAGPGFATADLADTVGPNGRVIAIERSPNFVAALHERALANVEVHEADLVGHELGVDIADGTWTRWVLAFLSDPTAVVAKIADALKPGGRALFHEYIDYQAWRLIPPTIDHHRYRDLVVKSWRDSGGEPDAALELPRQLAAAGLDLVSVRPMVEIITGDDPMWQWPASFVATNAGRLHELGYCTAEEASRFATMLDTVEPETRMMTPVVAELIAIKR
ncbi:MAG: methyltransferase domain-containing protein [Sphingomonas bacterium]|nr:methyltransferase domain-containing protein [Sphingomonas bacterium]